MIRILFKSDIDKVLAIEQAVHVVPWTEDTFKMCLQSSYGGWVMEVDDNIIGFVMASLTKEECHILNLCVAREHQHQGYGRKLLEHALDQATQRGIGIVYLEVRQSNSKAIALYRKMKFHLIGQRKDYYPTVAGYEDALIYAKSLVHTTD